MERGFVGLTNFSSPARIGSGESEKPEEKFTVLGESTKKLSRHDKGGPGKPPAPSPAKISKRQPEETKTPRRTERPASDTLLVDLDDPGREIEHPAYLLAHRKGCFHCEIFVRFDSPQGIKIRENLERKLKEATDRNYTISFKPTLERTLSIKFVPHLRLQDVDRSRRKLENVIKAFVVDQKDCWIRSKTRLESNRITWRLANIDPKSRLCEIATNCIADYLYERCGGPPSGKFEGNTVCDPTHVRGSFKFARSGNFDEEGFTNEVKPGILNVCCNINWLVNNGYTADEISRLGGLADARITDAKMLFDRKQFPVFRIIAMSPDDHKAHQMLVYIENLPSEGELADEIGRISQTMLCKLLKDKYEVHVSKDLTMKLQYGYKNSTSYKISWFDSKEPAGILRIIFFIITHEVRKLLLQGLDQNSIALHSSVLEENVRKTFSPTTNQ